VRRLLFEQCAAVFRSVLVNVRSDQLEDPTPCLPINVAQLGEKGIGHQNWVLAALQGREGGPVYPGASLSGGNVTDAARPATARGRRYT
jgi:hypothetical protein